MTSLFLAGDIILIDFPGVLGIRHGPAVVLSPPAYRPGGPELIVGLISSQTSSATDPADYLLQDWAVAGLPCPSVFRPILATIPPEANPTLVGRLTDADWNALRVRLRRASAFLDERPLGHD